MFRVWRHVEVYAFRRKFAVRGTPLDENLPSVVFTDFFSLRVKILREAAELGAVVNKRRRGLAKADTPEGTPTANFGQVQRLASLR